MTTAQQHRSTKLAGSPWEQQLLVHFEEHADGELDLIEDYIKLRERGPDHVRYLVDLILSDEAHHHQLYTDLVNRVRSDIDWVDYEPRVPYLERHGDGDEALAEATGRFLAFEHADRKSLRRLRKEVRPVRDTTLFSLLLDLMELDTQKHIAVLEFIRRSAQPAK